MKKISNVEGRNVLLTVTEGALFLGGVVFFHQMTILVVFVKRAWDSPLLVALVPAILFVGVNFPGIFTTPLAEKFPIRKKFILIFSLIQRLSILAMALCTLLLEPLGPGTMVALVLVSYTGFSFSGGIYFSAWIDFFSKTVPLHLRARTISLRSALGGLAGILCPLLIAYVLSSFSYPGNYRIIFIIGFAITMVSYLCFSFIKEEKPSPLPKQQSYRAYFRSLVAIIRRDRNFRNFLIVRFIWSVTACGPAFYTAYAIDLLQVTDATVAVYTSLHNFSLMTAGLLLGYLADKWSSLKIQSLGAISVMCEVCLLFFSPSHLTFRIVFFLTGIGISVNQNAVQVLSPQFAPEGRRIRYMSIVSILTGAAYGVMPVLAGILLSLGWLNIRVLFLICGGCAALVLFLYNFFVTDPLQG